MSNIASIFSYLIQAAENRCVAVRCHEKKGKTILHKKEIIEQIKNHVFQFKNWLSENYSQEKIDKELYDDTGYPNWNEVEDTFEIAFKELQFENLTKIELENISFLIARQWDIGIIFSNFREEISQIGMTEKQLLILGEYGINSKEWSFQQQCAASIWKANNYRKDAIKIAVKYYEEKDVDIRRHALNSLYKLRFNNLESLLEKSWKQNIELEKILCLQIWKEINESEFKRRIEEVKSDDREIIRKYLTEMN